MQSQFISRASLISIVTLACACRSFSPTPLDQVGFKERAESETRNGITVSVAVLSAEEAQLACDSKLYKKKIQPVWIEITNQTDDPMLFAARSVDGDYFSPFEVAQKTHLTWSKKANREKKRFFYDNTMPFSLPPGETVSGFVYANRDKGVRLVTVDIFGRERAESFEFIAEVPGFHPDYEHSDPGALYADRKIPDLDASGLREWILDQPCCVTNAKGTKQGDPLNLVIIGEDEAVWPAFLRVGWDPTAALTAGSTVKTGVFGVFGGRYRYSPVSSLYVYGRRQDISLQKVRSTLNYRNHLRLWMAPVTFRGLPVYLGQISRDIGSRLTTKSSTLTTHRIDPNVDETRAFLVQDFLYSKALAAFARAPGVGAAPPETPRGNLTGDPYFTDGNRAVLLITSTPTDVVDVEWFDWSESVGE
jgi:hypothetical protein